MRVLHINAGNLYGGVETLLSTLARSRDLTPDVEPEFAVCFDARSSKELAALGCAVHELGEVRIRRPLTVMRARRRLREILSTRRYDAVVCHMAWAQAIFGSAAHAAGVPGVMWQHMASNGRNWLEQLANVARPDLVICNSNFTAREMRGAFGGVQVAVVYCPVAPPSTNPAEFDRAAVRAELDTARDAVVIVHTGRMQEWKGHQLLLQAASKIRSKLPWAIWLVGGAQRAEETRYLSALRASATELKLTDRIRFTGERSDVARVLAASDIHCQPNVAPEPFGIAFIEALYAGLPVVTTRIGGGAEIVNDSCGVTVPPNEPSMLADALTKLIDDADERRRLGSAGPSRARELCDPKKQMQLLRKTLLELGDSRMSAAR